LNRREPTYHAEIDQRDAVAGQIHHVSRGRIGVEEAVHQDHLEHGIRAARSERLSVEAALSIATKSLPRIPSMCSCTFIALLVHSQ
jgi:hypothetical protein